MRFIERGTFFNSNLTLNGFKTIFEHVDSTRLASVVFDKKSLSLVFPDINAMRDCSKIVRLGRHASRHAVRHRVVVVESEIGVNKRKSQDLMFGRGISIIDWLVQLDRTGPS